MVVNATDRMLRVFTILQSEKDGISFELQNKFFDSVDRNQWIECAFSADADYVIGGLITISFSRLKDLIRAILIIFTFGTKD